jgi:hypothetical protein
MALHPIAQNSLIQCDVLQEKGETFIKQVVRYENINKNWKGREAMGRIGYEREGTER